MCLRFYIFLIILLLPYCTSISDWEEDDEDVDNEYFPDEIDDDNIELELAADVADENIVKINYIPPATTPKTYIASSGEPWTEQSPDMNTINEFQFEFHNSLMETNVDLSEKDVFDTLFTENIINK